MSETLDYKELGLKDSGAKDIESQKKLLNSDQSFDVVFKGLKERKQKITSELNQKLNDAKAKLEKATNFPTSFTPGISDKEKATNFIKSYQEKIKSYDNLIKDITDTAQGLYLPENAPWLDKMMNSLNKQHIKEKTLKSVQNNAVEIRKHVTEIKKNEDTLNKLLKTLDALPVETVAKVDEKKEEIKTDNTGGEKQSKLEVKKDVIPEKKSLLPIDTWSVKIDPIKVAEKNPQAITWGIKSGDILGVEEKGIKVDTQSADFAELESYLSKRTFDIWKKGDKPGSGWSPSQNERNISGERIMKDKNAELTLLEKAGKSRLKEFSKDFYAKNGLVNALNIRGDKEVAVLRIQPGTKTYQMEVADAQKIITAAIDPKQKAMLEKDMRSLLGAKEGTNLYFAKAGNQLFVRVVDKPVQAAVKPTAKPATKPVAKPVSKPTVTPTK